MSSPNRRHDRSSFCKYTTAETAKAILGGRVLRWSSPLLFNDPFDIPREATLAFSVEELFEASIALFLRMLSDGRQPGTPIFAQLKQEVERLDVPPHTVAKMMRVTTSVGRAKLEKGLEGGQSGPRLCPAYAYSVCLNSQTGPACGPTTRTITRGPF